MQKTVEIIVSGKVQGVFYRHGTREKAEELGITGFVQNLTDGRVRIIACGDEEDLETLYQWCRTGPPRAKVEGITKATIPVQVFPTFTVKK